MCFGMTLFGLGGFMFVSGPQDDLSLPEKCKIMSCDFTCPAVIYLTPGLPGSRLPICYSSGGDKVKMNIKYWFQAWAAPWLGAYRASAPNVFSKAFTKPLLFTTHEVFWTTPQSWLSRNQGDLKGDGRSKVLTDQKTEPLPLVVFFLNACQKSISFHTLIVRPPKGS